MYAVYRFRHIFSWLPVLLGAGWVMLNQHSTLKIEPRYDESTMELALVEQPVAETPPPVATPQPEPQPETETPPEPQPVEPEPGEPSPEPVAPPPKPAPKPKPQPKPKPKPQPAARATSKTAKPAAPVSRPAAPAVTAAKPAPPRVNSAAVENGWVAGLRRDMEAQKRYPTGRQASLERPEGSVEIWLEVDRSGRVLASGISNKARSMLLNRAALGSLQNIRQVKPFPADAFAGQNSRRFTATLNYRAP